MLIFFRKCLLMFFAYVLLLTPFCHQLIKQVVISVNWNVKRYHQIKGVYTIALDSNISTEIRISKHQNYITRKENNLLTMGIHCHPYEIISDKTIRKFLFFPLHHLFDCTKFFQLKTYHIIGTLFAIYIVTANKHWESFSHVGTIFVCLTNR